MWHSSDISMESLLDTCEFPAVCPVCGHRGGHIYLRADRPRRGGLWIWCSVLEMKRQIENREKLNRSLSLKEIMEASRFLKEEGISHDILPAIRYSRYYECGKKLKSLT